MLHARRAVSLDFLIFLPGRYWQALVIASSWLTLDGDCLAKDYAVLRRPILRDSAKDLFDFSVPARRKAAPTLLAMGSSRRTRFIDPIVEELDRNGPEGRARASVAGSIKSAHKCIRSRGTCRVLKNARLWDCFLAVAGSLQYAVEPRATLMRSLHDE